MLLIVWYIISTRCVISELISHQFKILQTYDTSRVLGEADSHLAGTAIPRLLCNPKIYNCLYTSTALRPILSQFNPVHTSFL